MPIEEELSPKDRAKKELEEAFNGALKKIKEEESVEETISDLQEEESSVEELVSNLEAEINQFINSTKEDITFFYDELAKLRNDIDTLTDKMNQIDEKINKLLIEKEYKQSIDMAKAEIIESNETATLEATPGDTLEAMSSDTGELRSSEQKKVELESSIKQPQIEHKIPLIEVINRLTAVGIFRGRDGDPYYTVCEILVQHDPQEMKYDMLLRESKLSAQTLSRVIFDLTIKNILYFDGKTEKVHLHAS